MTTETITTDEIACYARAFSDAFLHVAKRIERAPLSNAERLSIYVCFDECGKCIDAVHDVLRKQCSIPTLKTK